MRVALVHDWLNAMRGGEKALEAIIDVFPQADLYALLHKPGTVSPKIRERLKATSVLQRLPGVLEYYRYLLPVMPWAIGRMDLSGYDLVVSSSHCVAKGIRLAAGSKTRPLHVCYCFTPMRYIYGQFDNYFAEGVSGYGRLTRLAARLVRDRLAAWDLETSKQVDHFIAISETVRRRIERCYGREAAVIHPPVDTGYFTPGAGAEGGYYLVVSALVPYKRVDIAIEACRALGVPLKIVGRGTEENRLRGLARGADVEFAGWTTPAELRELYRGCRALLYPQEEDFGISAVEAMACGRPVAAFGRGGGAETVIDGETGVLFAEQTAEACARAVRALEGLSLSSERIREQALRFRKEEFTRRLVGFLGEKQGIGGAFLPDGMPARRASAVASAR